MNHIKTMSLVLLSILCISQNQLQARGGGVAAGVFGGLAAGALIGAAANHNHRRYYYDDDYYYRNSDYSDYYDERNEHIASLEEQNRLLREKIHEDKTTK